MAVFFGDDSIKIDIEKLDDFINELNEFIDSIGIDSINDFMISKKDYLYELLNNGIGGLRIKKDTEIFIDFYDYVDKINYEIPNPYEVLKLIDKEERIRKKCEYQKLKKRDIKKMNRYYNSKVNNRRR